MTTIAVVGLGSRGLGVLERIVTLAKRGGPAAGAVRVEVVDPTCTGAGVHDPAQPDYLLLNTTCSQVSMFPDAATVGDEVDAPGPSLHDWVTGRGLRLGDDGYPVGTGDTGGRPVRATDFLPRRVLGEYLAWVLDEVRRRAPAHVEMRLHRAGAVDLAPGPDGLEVTLSTGDRLRVDHAFLTTGYTPNTVVDLTPDGRRRRTEGPYPLPERVAGVEPGQVAALGGFGLSAMDVMSCLTVGRGGRFVEDVGSDGGLRYLPSGREPTLLFFSRTGLPCRARPRTVEFGPPYRPLVFTTATVDAVRRARGGPLDFAADVLPLVLTEVRVAYRWCQARLDGTTAALEADLAAGVAATLDRLDAERDRFDAAEAFDGAAGMLLDGPEAYQKWLAEGIRADLAEGVLGFAGSPVKAGLDVLRALRDTFRYVVDFGGLTAASIDVDRDQHPLDTAGRPERRIRVLGPLCECATFYNNLVPSPNVHSRPVHDAHRCVAAVLG